MRPLVRGNGPKGRRGKRLSPAGSAPEATNAPDRLNEWTPQMPSWTPGWCGATTEPGGAGAARGPPRSGTSKWGLHDNGP